MMFIVSFGLLQSVYLVYFLSYLAWIGLKFNYLLISMNRAVLEQTHIVVYRSQCDQFTHSIWNTIYNYGAMSVEYCNSVNAPKSLDIRFFGEVLEGALLEAFAEIKKISFEMGTAAGDNYCSQIYKVRLSFQRQSLRTENISVIVKSIIALQEPESMNMFEHGLFSEKGVNGFFEMHFGNCLKGLLELISEWEGFEAIAGKVKKIAANLKENLIKSQLPIPGELKVLNHGDLWTNNILFRYKNASRQEVEDAVFVDFQMSIYGSPGYDILFFIYGSAQLDVLIEKKDELIWTYYETLCEVLKSHSYRKIPDFADILREVRQREFFGFFAVSGILPVIAMDKTKSGDNSFEKFSDADSAKKNREVMFSPKRVQDTLRYALMRFDEMGVLD